jgi:hypothetical protein
MVTDKHRHMLNHLDATPSGREFLANDAVPRLSLFPEGEHAPKRQATAPAQQVITPAATNTVSFLEEAIFPSFTEQETGVPPVLDLYEQALEQTSHGSNLMTSINVDTGGVDRAMASWRT